MTKSLEAATSVLAAILACSAVSSLVNEVTFVARRDCKAVSSLVNEVTLVVRRDCRSVSSSATLATPPADGVVMFACSPDVPVMLIPSLPKSEIVIPPSLIDDPVRYRSFHFAEDERKP